MRVSGVAVQIAVAVDLSGKSAHGVRFAAQLASGLGAELYVVHVLNPDAETWDAPPALSDEESTRLLLGEREASLGELITSLELPVAAIPVVRAAAGVRPEDLLDELAVELDAAFVVVPTQRESGLRGFFLGSFAERFFKLSRLPVLVVPPSE